MKTLYHYTSIERWEHIQADGQISTTESNLSRETENAGPRVVWLTTDPDCSYGHGLLNSLDGTDKTRVRITVGLINRDVHKWKDWAIRRGIHPNWLRQVIDAAGGGAGTWRVTEKPTPIERWLEVVDRETGQTLWLPSTSG